MEPDVQNLQKYEIGRYRTVLLHIKDVNRTTRKADIERSVMRKTFLPAPVSDTAERTRRKSRSDSIQAETISMVWAYRQNSR